MSNNTLFKQFQIKGFYNHLENFFEKQIKKAQDKVKESKEYEIKKQEYLTTKDYERTISNIDENAAIKFADYIKYLVENIYNKEEDLVTFIVNAIYESWFIRQELGLSEVSISKEELADKINLDNYHKKIQKIIDKAIDYMIEDNQESYASYELLKWYTFDKKHHDKIMSLLHTVPVCSTRDLEQMVLNNFNFDEIVRK